MPAYAETYLMDAMENLGEMSDFAVHTFGLDLDEYWGMFIASGYAAECGEGSPRVVAGMSGSEIAVRVGERAGISLPECARLPVGDVARGLESEGSPLDFGLSCEYWCGWIMAYYQWRSARSFKNIWRLLGMGDVLRMYPTFHEESEERFAEAADEMIGRRRTASRLRAQRSLVGLSQSQLARASGVGIRAIQQYEQGAKDIGKASFDKIAALARALHCCPEDLMDPIPHYEYAVVRF